MATGPKAPDPEAPSPQARSRDGRSRQARRRRAEAAQPVSDPSTAAAPQAAAVLDHRPPQADHAPQARGRHSDKSVQATRDALERSRRALEST